MTNLEASFRLANIAMKHIGLNYEALHHGMVALTNIDRVTEERDKYKGKFEESNEWFIKNAGVLASHRIGGFSFE